MKVLVISPYADLVATVLRRHGETVLVHDGPPTDAFEALELCDFVVSHGYRHIIPAQVTQRWDGRLVNLHISLLPWNRGADPNFWSFFDGTPKGVSVHHIDSGIDTGYLIAQREVAVSDDATLASNYDRLQEDVVALFDQVWPALREGRAERRAQLERGSVHRKVEIEPLRYLLNDGWDTPVAKIEAAGRRARKVA
ncbi:MAG: formyltransferase family protein [Alphaproteobacteria bacterium]|nr:formyltransferase family protein [Alphaproteobacteria bacterium]